MLRDVSPVRLPGLATVVTAGEACPASVAAIWGPTGRLINAYGPTETTVCATWGVVSATAGTVPIGQPLAGTTVYVAAPDGTLAPLGSAGELWVGGAGVTRGVLAAAGADAARFVPDPLAERRAHGSIGPGTGCGGVPMGSWSIWGAATGN